MAPLTFTVSSVPPDHPGWCSGLTAFWSKGLEKTSDFLKFPGMSCQGRLSLPEEWHPCLFQTLRTPFQGCFENSSGAIQDGAGGHSPSPLGVSFPICRVGVLDQMHAFLSVPIKSSEEAPRF
ncbi:hypothetical protein HJG60_008907 [Phyllostomus discolor]|uniref:Uncharacterized protein n=1 Tax=Phyllostomus discolor TaxID=89673 RepID=A0A833YTN4_9CHIR|nr:hypothetical protein HJG60_008907 [Phyllostomus discolor]